MRNMVYHRGMSGPERRRHKRVPVRLPVKLYFSGQDDPVSGEIRNISESGAFVYCAHPVPKNSKVLIELQMLSAGLLHGKVHDAPGGKNEASVVRWEDSESGFGIEFLDIRPALKQFLADFVEAVSRSLHAEEDDSEARLKD